MYGNKSNKTKIGFGNYLISLGVSQKTHKNYLSDLNHFSEWICTYLKSEGTYTEDITDAIPFLNKRLVEEYKTELLFNEAPIKSLNRRLSTLRQLSRYLLTEGALEINFMAGVANVDLGTNKSKYDGFINDFKSYLISQKVTVNTLKNYISDIKHFTSWAIEHYPDIPLKDVVTVTHVMAYGEYLKPSFSYASQKRKAASISKFFDWIKSTGYINDNPFKFQQIKALPVIQDSTPSGYQTWTFMAISMLFAVFAVKTVAANYSNINSSLKSPDSKTQTLLSAKPNTGVNSQYLPLTDNNPATNIPMIFITADFALNESEAIDANNNRLSVTENAPSEIYLYATKYNNNLTDSDFVSKIHSTNLNPLYITTLKGRGVLNAYLSAKGLSSGGILIVNPSTSPDGLYINSIDRLFASTELIPGNSTLSELRNAYSEVDIRSDLSEEIMIN